MAQAHVQAQRILSEKGVWDGVAKILERHFSLMLAPVEHNAPESIPDSALSTNVVKSAESKIESQKAVPKSTVSAVPDMIEAKSVNQRTTNSLTKTLSVPSLASATETAHALAEAMLTKPLMEIKLVPNPLSDSVPNPLLSL